MRALVLTTLQHPHIWMARTKYSSCSTWIPLLPTLFSVSGDGLYRRRALKAPNIIIYQFTAMDKWVQPGDGLISLQSSLSPNHWFLGSTSQLLTLTNTQSNGAHLYSNTLSVHLRFFCSSLFPLKTFKLRLSGLETHPQVEWHGSGQWAVRSCSS